MIQEIQRRVQSGPQRGQHRGFVVHGDNEGEVGVHTYNMYRILVAIAYSHITLKEKKSLENKAKNLWSPFSS